jgi:hypothetical protein
MTAALAAGAVAFVGMAVAFAILRLFAPLLDFERTRRWRRTPGLRDVLPGTPAWAERERRVVAFATAVETLPIERFDSFEPEGVAEWSVIWHATDGSPRAVQEAVRSASGRIGGLVRGRAERERPAAGYDDYAIHPGGVWVLGDPHWEAAERAAEAAAVAMLLDGFLQVRQAAGWVEGGARLVG